MASCYLSFFVADVSLIRPSKYKARLDTSLTLISTLISAVTFKSYHLLAVSSHIQQAKLGVRPAGRAIASSALVGEQLIGLGRNEGVVAHRRSSGMMSHYRQEPYKSRVASSHRSSKSSYCSDQDVNWGTAPAYLPVSKSSATGGVVGGESMVWNYSNDSTSSSRSQRTSSSGHYSISSPTASYSYDSTSASSTSQAGGHNAYIASPYGGLLASPTMMSDYGSSSTPRGFVRSTPSSLGWTPDTKLWKLYKFVVTKGKEPYLELLPEYVCTRETPERVYLDPPKYVSLPSSIFILIMTSR